MKVRKGGREEIPLVQDKEQWLRFAGAAVKRYHMFKVRRTGGEEIPLFQCKEQWLRFTGAALRRYPMSKVRETQVGVARGHQKVNTLKP